jgi:23S rRNA (guanosine2251-2'-O)-methyltransferase
VSTTYIAGLHAVRHALALAPDRALTLFVVRERSGPEVDALVAAAREAGVAVQYSHADTLNDWVPGVRHQGVVLKARVLPPMAEADLDQLLAAVAGPPLLLVLDGVEDPHNLGAALRVADAAGVDAVVITRDRAASLTPAARKVASGAADNVPLVAVTNLARTLDRVREQGIWAVGLADAADRPFYDLDLRIGTALVLGAEGSGLRRLTRERCDFLASLPMRGVVESLNVSVTAGICLYEVVRQRRVPGR